MELDFGSNLFVCFVLVVCMFAGYGIVNLIGLGIMWLRDRRTNRNKWYVVGRVIS